jgi:hypothetical protein
MYLLFDPHNICKYKLVNFNIFQNCTNITKVNIVETFMSLQFLFISGSNFLTKSLT